jgi:hypothetical protein
MRAQARTNFVSDRPSTLPAMVFEVGMTVWRKGALGWEQGRISGQVFDHDARYITSEPGSTYVANGHQMRPVMPSSDAPYPS